MYEEVYEAAFNDELEKIAYYDRRGDYGQRPKRRSLLGTGALLLGGAGMAIAGRKFGPGLLKSFKNLRGLKSAGAKVGRGTKVWSKPPQGPAKQIAGGRPPQLQLPYRQYTGKVNYGTFRDVTPADTKRATNYFTAAAAPKF